MQTLLLLCLLAQVPVAPVTRPVEPAPFTFSDGQRSYPLWASAVLIAEPRPTAERGAALLALGAMVVVDRPTMRVWKGGDVAALQTKFPELRPVFHDNRAGVGRYRVPLGLVCAGQRRDAPWREVLEGSSGACLPDFWYPPVLK
ncbi:MAG: hypothetical protein Q8L48_09130 [Archangium sp.]|nr:hypothetical protein [Archangium sp.]